MARNLDEQLSYSRFSTPQPPPPPMPVSNPNSVYNPGGFAFAPSPNIQPSPYGPPILPTPQIIPDDNGLSSSFGNLSVNDGFRRPRANSSVAPHIPHEDRRQRVVSSAGPPVGYGPPTYNRVQSPSHRPHSLGGKPSLTAPLPTIPTLESALPSIQSSNADLQSKVAWIRDVLLLVNRSSAAASSSVSASSTDPPQGPARITDPALQNLVSIALPLLTSLAPGLPVQGQTLSIPLAEALYLRAQCAASGAFPQHIPHSQRDAFREFEAAARAGYHVAWFRLGRDYEAFGDSKHARDCFERGADKNNESCLFRLGMACLQGQLGLQVDYMRGVSMVHKAATLASVQAPQPAYVYALLLLGEFVPPGSSSPLQIPPNVFGSLVPPGSSQIHEARKHLERSAYLHCVPAQYKLGHCYEFAEPPVNVFDPLLSVQYYSLASQAGEAEADMALSKWFLCGSEGAEGGSGSFAKDETLAYTFAEKAAKKGLAAGEFAMGYYTEVGIGTARDLVAARVWYEKAAAKGNTDARGRLEALGGLSRDEHEKITESRLVRKRTQARQKAEATGGVPIGLGGRQDASQVVDAIRQNSMMAPQQMSSPGPGMPVPGNTTPQPQQSIGHQPPVRQSSLGPTGPIQAQQMPGLHRYSLVDGPSHANSASPPPAHFNRPSTGQGFGRGGGRVSSGSYHNGGQSAGASPKIQNEPLPSHSPSASPAPGSKPHAGTKYNTFADMGVAAGKAEDKDCVIM